MLYQIQGTARDGMGRVMQGATVIAFLSGSQTEAAVTATGQDGSFYLYFDSVLYSPTQLYDIQISLANYQTKIYTGISAMGLVGGQGSGPTISYATFIPVDSSTIPNYGIFVDIADGRLKWKDGSGTVEPILTILG